MTAPTVEDVIRRALAEIERSTGQATRLKDSDLVAMATAVQRVLEDCNGNVSDEGRVVELSARTLDALGDTLAARRLLVFGTGLVKTSLWEFSGKDPVWRLDLRKLVIDSGVQIEMAIFKSLSLVLETIADVWDASSGKGGLGLKHILSTAEQMYGEADGLKHRNKRNHDFAHEVLDRCRMKLADLASVRNWTSTPAVLSLD